MFQHKEKKVECSKIINLLSPYQDGELDENMKFIVEDHLKYCSGCKKLFDELEIVVNEIKNIGEVVSGENYTGTVMADIFDYEKSNRSFLMTFVYTFVFALFFLFGILINPFSGENTMSATGKADISSFFLQGQNFQKSDISNLVILQFIGGLDEKKVN